MEIHVDAGSERDAIEDVKGRGWVPTKAVAVPQSALPLHPEVIPNYRGMHTVSSILAVVAVLGYIAAVASLINSRVDQSITIAVGSVICHGFSFCLRALRDMAINSFRR